MGGCEHSASMASGRHIDDSRIPHAAAGCTCHRCSRTIEEWKGRWKHSQTRDTWKARAGRWSERQSSSEGDETDLVPLAGPELLPQDSAVLSQALGSD